MTQHPLKAMLDAGVMATVNSDDRVYFGGYVVDNYIAVRDALGVTQDEIVTLAKNSITASFLEEDAKAGWLAEIDAAVS